MTWLKWSLAVLLLVIMFTVEAVLICNGTLTERDLEPVFSIFA